MADYKRDAYGIPVITGSKKGLLIAEFRGGRYEVYTKAVKWLLMGDHDVLHILDVEKDELIK